MNDNEGGDVVEECRRADLVIIIRQTLPSPDTRQSRLQDIKNPNRIAPHI